MYKIKDNIYYVGVKDPTMRFFDIVTPTGYGSTYNSYLITGEKNVLVECVHEKLTAAFIRNIEEIMPVSDIDYIVINHSEPDHSGSVNAILEKNPQVTIVATIAALKNLGAITNREFNEIPAKNDGTLDIGGAELKFVIAPNLHWPDTMMTYYAKEKILFSCDALGAHYCEDALFDDEVIHKDLYREAFKIYYDCIVSPFYKFVIKGVEKLRALDIDMVCNSHGPILRSGFAEAIAKYAEWAEEKEESGKHKSVSVFYVSAYGYTREMAEIITDTINKEGIETHLFDIMGSDDAEMVEALNRSTAVAFGSPTMNRNALKPVWDMIADIDLVNRKGAHCMVFGSYGWGGEGLNLLHQHLALLGLKPFEKPFGSNFRLSDEKKAELIEYTKRFVDLIKE